MNNLSSKLSSRKLWICVAAFLASFGTGIGGLALGNETVTLVGAICCVVSSSIYAACEAYVDGKAAGSNQTIATTSVTATSSSQKVVEKAFMPNEEKSE